MKSFLSPLVWLMTLSGLATALAAGTKLEEKREHWAFKPVIGPALPAVKDKAWPRSEVDRFILARLEREGLRPSPVAERVVWLRRVAFDLTGLPPAPEQVAAFLADSRPDAFERVMEDLLASPLIASSRRRGLAQ